MEERAAPKYIDGIYQLHAKLYKFFMDAKRIASMVLPKNTDEADKCYRIYINHSLCDSFSNIKGYYIYDNFICRFLPISIEPAALFPVRAINYRNNDEYNTIGLTSDNVLGLSIYDSILNFSQKKFHYPYYLFNCELESLQFSRSELNNKLDDVGLPFLNFSDINKLKQIIIPQPIKESTYRLKGTKDNAPFSKLNALCYCVLYAELNNNAIKVLRWFPSKRDDAIKNFAEYHNAQRMIKNLKSRINQIEQCPYYSSYYDDIQRFNDKISLYEKFLPNHIGDYFFELGYLANYNNTNELYQFMIKNDARLLFGKIINNTIKITGSISIFLSSELKYPACISNIKIY